MRIWRRNGKIGKVFRVGLVILLFFLGEMYENDDEVDDDDDDGLSGERSQFTSCDLTLIQLL